MNRQFKVSTILLTTLAALSVTDSACQSADRKVFLYTLMKAERAWIERSPGKWIGTHPTNPLVSFTELERDETQIIIQNNSTKLIIRLTDGRAYWRRPTDTDWTTYVKGVWGELPESIAKTLPSPPPQKSAGDYVIKAAYFVPSDREPVANWERKIQVILHYVESMYRNDLKLKRLKSDGIRFESINSKPQVHLIRGTRPASYYNNAPEFNTVKQFNLLSPEIAAVLGERTETVSLVFAETYDERPAEKLWNGVIALGGRYSTDGGLGIFSAHLLKDIFCATSIDGQRAKFFDTTPVPGRKALGHSVNTARCEFVEDGFGAVIHEMGHALGLPHDMRDQKRYIMSNGFRQIRRNLMRSTRPSQLVTFSDINTSLLMSSRYVNPNLDLNDNDPPRVEFEMVKASRNMLQVRIEASDNTGLRVWGISDKAQDSLIAGGVLNKKEWSQTMLIPARAEAGKFQLNLIVADEGGNQTRVPKTFSMTP